MGAGTGRLTRPNVFRIVVAFREVDGVKTKALRRMDQPYDQFDKAMKKMISFTELDAEWTPNSGDPVTGGVLLLRGLNGGRNIETDAEARTINCNVDEVLRGLRVNQHKQKDGTSIRRATGVSAVVTHNIGPAPDEQSGDFGQHKGPCDDCCANFRIMSSDPR